MNGENVEVTAIEKHMTFEGRIKDRIKDGIEDLMSDQDILDLVHKALDDVFFKERVRVDNWGHKEIVQPLAYEMAKELLSERLEKAVLKWIKDNEDLVEYELNRVLVDGAGQALAMGFSSFVSSSVRMMAADIENKMRKIQFH